MIGDGKKQKGSVLVADGDKHLRKQLSIILNRMGYNVVVTGKGESALDLFIKRSFDIVFTALKMPGKSIQEARYALQWCRDTKNKVQ
jgi:DNA-binding NtrC family response regulator